MTNKQIAIFAFMAAFIALFCWKACKWVDENVKVVSKITDSTAHVASFKKSISKDKVKVLDTIGFRLTKSIAEDKKAKKAEIAKHDSVINEVAKITPPNCDSIAKVHLGILYKERKRSEGIDIKNDSLTNVLQLKSNELKEIQRQDSILLAKAKQGLTACRDSIPNPRWQRFKNKALIVLTTWAAAKGTIYVIKNVK